MKRVSVLAGLALFLALPGAALAAGGETELHNPSFTFEGPFGSFDQMQLQRGLQVYQEVCSACHGMKYLSFRDLGSQTGPALPEEQVKAFAALYEVTDAETGEPRAARPSDRMPANTGANAPDLSLMAKARAAFHGPYGTGISQLINGTGGPEYIFSILTGYRDDPACAADANMDGYYNVAFAVGGFPDSCKDEHGHHTVPGSWIAMPPPLSDDLVTYTVHGGDGSEVAPSATTEQMAKDVSTLLMWAAEPHLVERKAAGFRNILFLIVLAVLLYYTNKRIWAPVKHPES